MQFLEPDGLPQPAGPVQIFRAEQAEEFRMLEKITPGEECQFADAFLRAAVADMQRAFGGADADIGFLEHSEVELLLVAEIMIEHALVGAGALGDRIDASPAHAVFGKFPGCGIKDSSACPLRIALGRPFCRWASRPFLSPFSPLSFISPPPSSHVALISLRCEIVKTEFEEPASDTA